MTALLTPLARFSLRSVRADTSALSVSPHSNDKEDSRRTREGPPPRAAQRFRHSNVDELCLVCAQPTSLRLFELQPAACSLCEAVCPSRRHIPTARAKGELATVGGGGRRVVGGLGIIDIESAAKEGPPFEKRKGRNSVEAPVLGELERTYNGAKQLLQSITLRASTSMRGATGPYQTLTLVLALLLVFALFIPSVLGAAALLGTGGSSGSGDGAALGTIHVDTADLAMTRVYGDALKLDVRLLEWLTAGGTLRATPTHFEFAIGEGKWSSKMSDSKLSLYLNDKVLLQLERTASSTILLHVPGSLVARDMVLGKAESAQMRVDMCTAKATLAGDSSATIKCEEQREAAHLSVQQSLDVLSGLLLDTARYTVLTHAATQSAAPAAAAATAVSSPTAAGTVDAGKIKDIVKQTWTNELQPLCARDLTAKTEAAKEDMRREMKIIAAQQVKASASSGGGGGGGGGGGASASGDVSRLETRADKTSQDVSDLREKHISLDALWRDNREKQDTLNAASTTKLDGHAAAIASLQSTLAQSEAARIAGEETISSLRERVSKLEVLVELLLKKM